MCALARPSNLAQDPAVSVYYTILKKMLPCKGWTEMHLCGDIQSRVIFTGPVYVPRVKFLLQAEECVV